ncbi:hypothetical protein [Streptomyces anulatus]|uniref:hypothetical protein n=1 Tax=Streptomyces anulatus TaxID=1892 RepID=UPI00342D1925
MEAIRRAQEISGDRNVRLLAPESVRDVEAAPLPYGGQVTRITLRPARADDRFDAPEPLTSL